MSTSGRPATTLVARTPWWKTPRSWAGIALALAASMALLSVNVFPVTTNDSVVYLRMSNDLSDFGWVYSGFRQAGYPVVLAVVRSVAELVGADGLLAIALLQRLLLVAAGLLAWVHWRWWAIPLLSFLLAVETVAYPNLVLIEGLGLPVAILIVFPTIGLMRKLSSDEPPRMAWVYAGLIVLGALLLVSLRFTYLVFGAIPLFLAWAGWKTPLRRVTSATFVSFALLAGLFTLALGLENQRQFGSFFPSVNGEPTEYYYAWLQVFGLEKENTSDPSLAEFYDDGNVYDFGTEVNALEITDEERAALFEEETNSMLEASGMSVMGSRLESGFWALAGGRIHDISSIVDGVTTSTRWNIDARMYRNNFALENGAQAFADEFNGSKLPAAVITDPIGVALPIPSARRLMAVLLPLSLILMAWAVRSQRTRVLALIGLTIASSTAIGVGWIRADNFRFLLPSSACAVALATALIPLLRTGDAAPTAEDLEGG